MCENHSKNTITLICIVQERGKHIDNREDTEKAIEISDSGRRMLRIASLFAFAGLTAGYGIGARAALRRTRGGMTSVHASAAAPPADAVSMKVRRNPNRWLDPPKIALPFCDTLPTRSLPSAERWLVREAYRACRAARQD